MTRKLSISAPKLAEIISRIIDQNMFDECEDLMDVGDVLYVPGNRTGATFKLKFEDGSEFTITIGQTKQQHPDTLPDDGTLSPEPIR